MGDSRQYEIYPHLLIFFKLKLRAFFSPDVFMEAADMMRDSVRFGHVSDEATLTKYSFKENIVLFRPKVMSNKFEPAFVKYEGAVSKLEVKKFIKQN